MREQITPTAADSAAARVATPMAARATHPSCTHPRHAPIRASARAGSGPRPSPASAAGWSVSTQAVASARAALVALALAVALALGIAGSAVASPRAAPAPGPTPPSLRIRADAAPALRFGQALAAHGDVVAIAAPTDGDSGGEPGSVRVGRLVLDRARGATRLTYLDEATLPARGEGDRHGVSLAIAPGEAAIGPAETLLAVGADQSHASTESPFAGAVHLYTKPDGGLPEWSHAGTLTAPAPQPGAEFGRAIAFGQLGSQRVLAIGAPRHDLGEALDAGCVEVFIEVILERSGGTPAWRHFATLTAPQPQTSGWFGRSLAFAGEVLVIGSPGEHAPDPASEQGVIGAAGAVHLFELEDIASPALPAATLRHGQPAHAAWFGLAVAASGRTIVIGAPRARREGVAVGDLTVFELGGGAGESQTDRRTIDPPFLQAGMGFGGSLALDEDALLVGASGVDDGVDAALIEDLGACWRHELAAAGPGERLSPPEVQRSACFGAATAIARVDGRAIALVGHMYTEEESVEANPPVGCYLPRDGPPELSADTTWRASASSPRPSRSR